ncbi:MAG: GMC family oxidoreductase N-terminal domain-containing protein [Methanobacteriaceae archaeon]|jgi:choline dehydrogenase-like flavoprotein|nr:GMC family oxidoreductase N-terminal domain-containing protein [Candidatus Methanorudis spinitermitis]
MVVIVGSGAGGGILAMELALANIPVTIVEKGPFINVNDAFNCYDEFDEPIDLLKTTCLGGSTVVAAGNGVRVLEKELNNLGINISNELDEVEKLLSIHPMNDNCFGEGTRKIMDVANDLDLDVKKMPKFIRDNECIPCGHCSFGCLQNAKWSSIDFVRIAIDNGAKLLCNSEVVDIVIEDNKVKGVRVRKNHKDEDFKDGNFRDEDCKDESFKDEDFNTLIESDLVILAAGAIDSAILLQKIGIKAGEKLFIDSFVTIGGKLKNINFNKEIQMNALIKGRNFILSPHYAQFIANELKKEATDKKDILGIMIKIPDDNYGKIKDGKVIKENSIKDVRFIAEGSAIAGAILIEAGVDPNSIISTNLRGAHPGGTAAIGEIVNENLESEINGLFVSDASVLPKSPGAPPILTILALSKRLSKYIINNCSG